MKWTKEKCKEEALKYSTRSEFHEKNRRSYISSSKNGWMNEICSHMKPINFNNRCIYAYEFSDNNVYIGLTYNLKNRDNRHRKEKNSAVNRHIEKTKIIPKLIQLTEYQNIEKSKEMENFYVEKYKKENWIILNRAKTGSLGGTTIYWTKEKCQEESLKYKTKSEFYKKSTSSYSSSLKNNWIDEICSHMKNKRKKSGHWNNYENCLNESLKYNNKIEFSKNSPGAYNSSKLNGWYEKICSHMERPSPYNLKWTKEECQKEALRYVSKINFQKGSPSSYMSVVTNGWLDELCSHMERPSSYNLKWTKEECQKEALRYNRRNDFAKGKPGVYSRCQKQKWLDEICGHMLPKKLKNYWTKEKCIEESKKYKTRTEFSKKSSTAYQLCSKNKWFDD